MDSRYRLFAYGPADATAFQNPHHLLPDFSPDWFYLFFSRLITDAAGKPSASNIFTLKRKTTTTPGFASSICYESIETNWF